MIIFVVVFYLIRFVCYDMMKLYFLYLFLRFGGEHNGMVVMGGVGLMGLYHVLSCCMGEFGKENLFELVVIFIISANLYQVLLRYHMYL
jgi:hypothetical protein